jgi:replicative DNA helicase
MNNHSTKLGDKLVHIVADGAKGFNIGYKHGIKALEKFVPYIQRSRIITVLAGTGVGKSLFVVHSLAFEALLDFYYNYKSTRVFYWICYSMEMSEEDLLARLGSYILFRNYSIAVTPAELLSSTGKELSEEVKALINGEIKELLNELSQYVEIRTITTVEDANRRITDFYLLHGDIEVDKYNTMTYTSEVSPFLLVSFDHVALLQGEGSKKSKIDKLAEIQIRWAGSCGTTFIDIQQLNREEGKIEKFKIQKNPKPSLAEAKDSGDLIDASHLVLALFSAARYDIDTYYDFNILGNELTALKDNYRAIHLLKNRHGGVGLVHAIFYGAVGYFQSITAELRNALVDNVKAIGLVAKIRKLKKI